MVDSKHIGFKLPTLTWAVERGRLLAFAKAIGETRSECLDESAAQAAGYTSLLAPPTFCFGAIVDGGSVEAMLAKLQVPIARVLHAEQSFVYLAPICAGDVLTVTSEVADIAEKKGGKLVFITLLTTYVNQHDALVCETRAVIAVRS